MFNLENIVFGVIVITLVLGIFIGFVLGINDQKKRNREHYTIMINAAMKDAYQAGYADGKAKKRNLGDF